MKRLLLTTMLLAVMLTGCSAPASTKESNQKETQSVGSTEQETESKEKPEESKESENLKEKADIESLAKEASFNVNWYTQDGEYASGTAFVMDSEVHGEKLLVTAFHFLWPEDAETFTGEELPDYVWGGEIFYAYDYSPANAFLKNCVIIKDADAMPNVDKDVAAFTIQGNDELRTLPLAETEPKKGDKVYLLASLWDTEDIHENCVYEGEVSSVEGGSLYYTLEGKPGTSGASGGPIVNEYGEVVGIHMGSNPFCCVAHTTQSFVEQINNGTISDITYEEVTSQEEEPSGTEAGYDYAEFERADKVSTNYFDVQIDAVTLSDSVNGVACEEGYQYVTMDVSLWAPEGATEGIPMYYSDFSLDYEDEYCYPLEAGLTDTQLPDEYTITQEVTTGQLIFMAPLGEETAYFSFYNAYYENATDVEPIFVDYYAIVLPLENWTR